jgi:hypothetical protein
MNQVQTINLRDICRRYLNNDSTQPALNVLDGSWPVGVARDLDWLLRNHETDGAIHSNVERELRNSFDELLAFYSLIEIGCISGFLSSRLPEDFQRVALDHLSNVAVRRYYEVKYPLLLPLLLRLRLKNGRGVEADANKGVSVYQQFLEVNSVFEDSDVSIFVWMLDGGSVNTSRLRDMLDLLDKPLRYAGTLLKPVSWQSTVDHAIKGFGKFLEFCVLFDSLLRQARETPILRSALWHYHAYWFNLLNRHLRGRLRDTVQRVSLHHGAELRSEPGVESVQVLAKLVDLQNGIPP